MNKSELNKSEAVNIFSLKFGDRIRVTTTDGKETVIGNFIFAGKVDKHINIAMLSDDNPGCMVQFTIPPFNSVYEVTREPEITEAFSPEKLGFKEYESNKDYWHPSWFKNETRKTPDGKPYEDIHKWQIRKLINHDNRYLIKHYKDVKGAVYPEVVFTEFNINSHSDGLIILKSLGII